MRRLLLAQGFHLERGKKRLQLFVAVLRRELHGERCRVASLNLQNAADSPFRYWVFLVFMNIWDDRYVRVELISVVNVQLEYFVAADWPIFDEDCKSSTELKTNAARYRRHGHGREYVRD